MKPMKKLANGVWCVGAVIAINLTAAQPATAQSRSFKAWVEGVRSDALGQGISRATLDAALKDLRPIPDVIEKDRTQPKFTMTFVRYQRLIVSRERIDQGRARYAEHRALLESVSRAYGVPARFIVALWGIESYYGRITGTHSVIAAVATLAHARRRSRLFRRQLLAALKIVDRGDIGLEQLKGSWAGAMGQVQFIPTSYLAYAVDHDKDGRRDIWTTKADVFASAANYLKRNGWRTGETWGRPVILPKRLRRRRAGRSRRLADWRRLGLHGADGRRLPVANVRAALLRPGGHGGPAYLVYNNYRVILRWNRSHHFAVAVGRLADAIGRR